MSWMSRRRVWRIVIAPVVVIALSFAYVTFAHHDARPQHAVHLSASDLLLAATQATRGIFLEYDGVTGPPSTNHANHARLTSVAFSVKRPVTFTPGEGRAVAPTSVGEIRITKVFDKYSTPLIHESLSGGGTHNAIIYFMNVNAAGAAFEYLEFDLTDVLVSSYSMSSGGGVPTEAMTLNFTKFVVKAHVAGSPAQALTYDISLGRVS
jgi:type VI secretion system secreted protein Hcp